MPCPTHVAFPHTQTIHKAFQQILAPQSRVMAFIGYRWSPFPLCLTKLEMQQIPVYVVAVLRTEVPSVLAIWSAAMSVQGQNHTSLTPCESIAFLLKYSSEALCYGTCDVSISSNSSMLNDAKKTSWTGNWRAIVIPYLMHYGLTTVSTYLSDLRLDEA